MNMFALSCASFHGNMTAGMVSMLESEEMSNVTIAVEGKQLKAHQMVLSICSPYFKSLLLANPCTHPIIFMKDVKYHIMKDLLRFMYEGQTQIKAEDMQVFVDTAEALQIKWLTESCDQHSVVQPQQCQSSAKTTSTKRIRVRPHTPQENISHASDSESVLEKLLTQRPTLQPATKRHKLNEKNGKSASSAVPFSFHETNEMAIDYNEESTMSEEQNRFLVDPLDELIEPDEYDAAMAMVKIEKEEIDSDNDNADDNDYTAQIPDVHMLTPTTSSMQRQHGDPVVVTFVRCRNITQIVVNKHRYSKKVPGKVWMTWRCRSGDDSCKAYIHLTNDDRIIFRNEHNHPPRRTPADLVTVYDKHYSLVSLNDFLYNRAPSFKRMSAKKLKDIPDI